jgi:hypothetical protein
VWVARAVRQAGLLSAVSSMLELLVAALAWEQERKVSTAWGSVLGRREVAKPEALPVSAQTVWKLLAKGPVSRKKEKFWSALMPQTFL